MPDINEVRLLGHLGADPEIRYTPNGTKVVSMSVGTNYSTKDNAGNWVDHTEWHKVGISRRQADYVSESFKKGTRVHVSGFIRTRQWQQNGKQEYCTEIAATLVIGLKNTVEKKDDPEKQPGNQSNIPYPKDKEAGY